MKNFKHNSDIYPREPRWSSIDCKRLPDEAGVSGKYFHHWVRNSKRKNKEGKYIGGELFLHRGGLISAIKEAEQAGDREAIEHLSAHAETTNIKEDMAMKRSAFKAQEVNMDNSGMVFGRAPVTAEELSLGDRIPTDISSRLMKAGDDVTDRDMDMINAIARTPLNREDVFIFPMWISNSLNDAYYTRMDVSSLNNFLGDLKSSRALQLAHGGGGFFSGADSGMAMPVGASFNGEMTAREGYDGEHLLGWYYVVRGVNIGIGNMTTQDIERNIQAGVYRRGSIGFTVSPIEGRAAGRFICSICRSNLVSSTCPHIPGLRYEDEDGNFHLCIAEIHGAGMRESSLVPMNAAQGTVVEKARQFASEGKLSEKNARVLEYAYQTRILIDGNQEQITPPVRAEEPPAGKPQPKTEKQQEEIEMEKLQEFVRSLADLFPGAELATREITEDGDIAGVREVISGAIESIRAERGAKIELVDAIPEEYRSIEKINEAIKEAGWGRSYHNDLITEAITEGVRAYGNEFDKDHWRDYLSKQEDVEVIRKTRESFKKTADQKVKPGRTTEDGDGRNVIKVAKPAIPDNAHKMGK